MLQKVASTNKFILTEFVSLEFLSPEEESFKFGYYDNSPISKDGKKLLAHKIDFEGRDPLINDKVELGYFDLASGNWHKIVTNKAFNWQLGSLLQWLGPDFSTKVIYNDVLNGAYISKIFDVTTNEIISLPKAVYSCDLKGEYSYTLNFERAQFTRAYSYVTLNLPKWDVPIPEFDGVVKLNLQTGYYHRIISISEIVEYKPQQYHANAYHWLEHVMLNPDNDIFAVYHRFGNINKFRTRCLFVNLNGEIIDSHDYLDNEFISHLGWRSSKEYVMFTRRISKLEQGWKKAAESNQFNYKSALIKVYRAVVKPFVPKKLIAQTVQKKKDTDNYQVAEVGIGKKGTISITPANIDGHPSFTRDGRFMLTDTYEDAQSWRHLVIYDTQSQKTLSLGKFYSVYNNCSWRTDLHPRFSWDEKSVVVDSNHNGKNSVVVLEVDWEKIYEAFG